jgi:hypothetical protein
MPVVNDASVVHNELQISLQIFKKKYKKCLGNNGKRVAGRRSYMKKPEFKNLMTPSL